jgi:hypothetical protein
MPLLLIIDIDIIITFIDIFIIDIFIVLTLAIID